MRRVLGCVLMASPFVAMVLMGRLEALLAIGIALVGGAVVGAVVVVGLLLAVGD